MVPVPIPETYTVPQSYQPRRPAAPHFDAPSSWPDSDTASHSGRSSQAGPIPVASPAAASGNPAQASPDWNHYIAAGAFLAAGALLATGHRRLGIAAAAAGAATVLLEDTEAVAVLCQQAPNYLAQAQSLVDQIQQLLRGSLGAVEAVRR